MNELAADVWIFDGEPVPFFGLPYFTRMTVIRLSSGKLWVHSPIKLSEEIIDYLNALGEVRYLIAPNHLHHLFLPEWQSAYPAAEAFATDELIKKRKDIPFDASFNEDRDWPWTKDIDQVLFTGSPAMEECVFFHKQSKTLIVTDLIENFSGDSFNTWQKALARFTGIVAPNGKTPLDWRLSFIFGKSKARRCFKKMYSWSPSTIVMAHGVIVTENASDFLDRSFSWLR